MGEREWSAEVAALADELVALTGESVEVAVATALRQRIAREHKGTSKRARAPRDVTPQDRKRQPATPRPSSFVGERVASYPVVDDRVRPPRHAWDDA